MAAKEVDVQGVKDILEITEMLESAVYNTVLAAASEAVSGVPTTRLRKKSLKSWHLFANRIIEFATED